MVFSSRLANARPVIKLMATQPSITVTEGGGLAALDPRILVAALGSPLEFDVSRRNYTAPVEIAQVVHSSRGRTEDIELPQRILDGWNGLKNFISLTVENDNGRTLAMRTITLCPNALNPDPLDQHSPIHSPYPHLCTTADPFQLSMIWGIERNWAIDPTAPTLLHPTYPIVLHLTPGRYRVTESITPSYVRLFGIPASGATASAQVTVETSTTSGGGSVSNVPRPAVTEIARPPIANPGSLRANSPEDSLPDLVAQPAWGIGVTSTSGRDYLGFGATIWVSGNGPLDIEGFRSAGSADMKAYQYFWHNGRIVGAVPAGTIKFDSQTGHGHWHFHQFARYRLLNAARRPGGPRDPPDSSAIGPRRYFKSGRAGRLGAPHVRELHLLRYIRPRLYKSYPVSLLATRLQLELPVRSHILGRQPLQHPGLAP